MPYEKYRGMCLMEISKKKLIKEYTKAIEEGRAGIFAGAGLSIDSGYVNWKELMLKWKK